MLRMNTNAKLFSIVTLSVGLCVFSLGCDDSRTPPEPNTPPARTRADNTANNNPNRATSTVTPMDQKENQSDVSITANIRQAVMKAENMSTNGQNVKIVTADGVVTLRGPVASAAEKQTIGQLATNATGVKRVDNQLEVNVPR